MTRAAASLIAIISFVGLPACTTDDSCNATTCPDGCCGGDGVCRPSAPKSCGLQGAACDDCPSRQLACVNGACEEYEPNCIPNGNACLGGTCCSQLCSKGKCSDTPCQTNGTSCESTTVCCSDVCDEGTCKARGLGGEPCSLTRPCLEPLVCTAGVCAPPCLGSGMSCTPGQDQCCAEQGMIPCPEVIERCPTGCRNVGQSCGSNGDCCSGQCQGNYCVD